jgi:hypothetical protein
VIRFLQPALFVFACVIFSGPIRAQQSPEKYINSLSPAQRHLMFQALPIPAAQLLTGSGETDFPLLSFSIVHPTACAPGAAPIQFECNTGLADSANDGRAGSVQYYLFGEPGHASVVQGKVDAVVGKWGPNLKGGEGWFQISEAVISFDDPNSKKHSEYHVHCTQHLGKTNTNVVCMTDLGNTVVTVQLAPREPTTTAAPTKTGEGDRALVLMQVAIANYFDAIEK